jgi:predicted transposase/invertase (TIGR01784 family)
MTISKDEVERARLMSEYKYEVDTQSKIVTAKRDGVQEGLQKGKRETAKNLKKRGLPIDQIAEDTGLPRDEIERL